MTETLQEVSVLPKVHLVVGITVFPFSSSFVVSINIVVLFYSVCSREHGNDVTAQVFILVLNDT